MTDTVKAIGCGSGRFFGVASAYSRPRLVPCSNSGKWPTLVAPQYRLGLRCRYRLAAPPFNAGDYTQLKGRARASAAGAFALVWAAVNGRKADSVPCEPSFTADLQLRILTC